MTQTKLRAQPLGDSAITIALGNQQSPELLERVHATAALLAHASLPEVQDIVPAYLAVAVFYDPLLASYEEMSRKLLDVCASATASTTDSGAIREHELRVTYDGPDLEQVAVSAGLTVAEVIARHSRRTYTVDLLGFVPGFGYMSELDSSLHLPRRAQPRPRVPAGSVAIAGAQTAIYPLDTPGGWHLIGSTDAVLFDPLRDPPAVLRAGDKVRFLPIP
ncbi:MAG: 5-oxoprolinase subunit PxpB [Gemmatimonadota bacterium]|nr:5-oxoprolinase subunit PxpB [Gemmatimonadota bacterium]